MRLLSDSIKFAIEAHSGQFRKFDKTPYIKHPLSVMGMMTELTDEQAILSACVLHDTVEDCEDVTLEIIHERFGEIVAGYVFYVTAKSQKTDGSRKIRKEIDRIHYSIGSDVSQNIKVLDMIDNIPSMVLYDSEFAKLYIKEKLNLLETLTKASSAFRNKAFNLITVLRKKL